MKLSIGNAVEYRLWGDTSTRSAVVESIEICREGLKEGRSVKHADLEKHSNVVLDLSDGHWIYHHQIENIKKD